MRQILMAAAAVVTTALPALADVAPGSVKFVDGAVEASLTGVPGDPAAGAKVIGNRGLGNCVACHQIGTLPQLDFQGNIGPALDGAADRWSEAELRGIVANAKMLFEGTFMPAFYKNTGFVRPGDAYTGKAAPNPQDMPTILTAQQVEDVVAYLLTLKE
jgi:sulfur-oxidizing protein SoxX